MWPPTEDDFKKIANTILNNKKLYNGKKEIKALVYCDSPELIIMEPVHFANTEYKEMSFRDLKEDVNLVVVIGKED